MTPGEYQALKSALLWHIDAGADLPLADSPVGLSQSDRVDSPSVESVKPESSPISFSGDQPVLLGASEARAESVRLALAAQTLDDLKQAIAGFDGISLKDTATNLVFCDGNPDAPVMLIGEAPGGDEDRLGKPFVGVSGQLLDRILACIGLDRAQDDPLKSIYISNILNWRPPGNRTPTDSEIAVSLPFIERHIQLAGPKLLILAGGVSAKALLGSGDSISKLRGRFQSYLPQTPELREGASPIPVLATYHPAYLLRTPGQKRLVWADMLVLLEKRRDLGII
jgi:DNA polymerase